MIRALLVAALLMVPFTASAAGLTGLWVGYYQYENNERVPMSVAIQSKEERFLGQMIEPQTFGDTLDVGMPAVISGKVEGASVSFDKAYFSELESLQPITLKDGAIPVHYTLTLSDDGQTMTGKWSLRGMTGTAVFKRITSRKVDEMR